MTRDACGCSNSSATQVRSLLRAPSSPQGEREVRGLTDCSSGVETSRRPPPSVLASASSRGEWRSASTPGRGQVCGQDACTDDSDVRSSDIQLTCSAVQVSWVVVCVSSDARRRLGFGSMALRLVSASPQLLFCSLPASLCVSSSPAASVAGSLLRRWPRGCVRTRPWKRASLRRSCCVLGHGDTRTTGSLR